MEENASIIFEFRKNVKDFDEYRPNYQERYEGRNTLANALARLSNDDGFSEARVRIGFRLHVISRKRRAGYLIVNRHGASFLKE